jgi:hypothetical protein
MKKVVFQKWFSRSTPTLTPVIAHVARWPRGRAVGVCPSARPPFHQTFCLFVCHSLSISLNLSYLVLRVLVRACRQEELHGGGVTVARGLNESRVAKLCMRGKRIEDGVSERQKRGTRCACAARAWLGGGVNCGPGLYTCRNESTCVVRGCRRKKRKYDKWHFQTKRR